MFYCWWLLVFWLLSFLTFLVRVRGHRIALPWLTKTGWGSRLCLLLCFPIGSSEKISHNYMWQKFKREIEKVPNRGSCSPCWHTLKPEKQSLFSTEKDVFLIIFLHTMFSSVLSTYGWGSGSIGVVHRESICQTLENTKNLSQKYLI